MAPWDLEVRGIIGAASTPEGVAIGQEVAIGLEVVGARHVDAPALKALEAMLKHRPVDFLQHVEAHGDLEVRRDADEVAVEGGVVELAEREAVGNDRAPPKDVSGCEQLVMAEATDAQHCWSGTRSPRQS